MGSVRPLHRLDSRAVSTANRSSIAASAVPLENLPPQASVSYSEACSRAAGGTMSNLTRVEGVSTHVFSGNIEKAFQSAVEVLAVGQSLMGFSS